MANMTFNANLLPKTDLDFDLGSSTQRWNIYGTINGTKIFWGTCSTAAATYPKVVVCPEFTADDLVNGTILFVTFDNKNTAAVANIKLLVNGVSKAANSAGDLVKKLYNAGLANLNATGEIMNGVPLMFIFNGTNWILQATDYNSTYYYTSIYCTTAASTAAKVGSISSSHLLTAGKYFQVWIYYSNTAESALTLNISGKGAKPIYINGVASSATNHTLPAGCYIVYDDGTNYHFRTDNKLPGNIVGDAGTVNGHTVNADVPSGAVFTDVDRYVNSAAFTDNTSTDADNPIRMTLTRAGSDSVTVTADIPKVSSSSAGVAPKGTAVSSQNQNTKFLREDGTWAKPSYTTNSNTTYTFTDGTNSFTVTPSGGTAQTVNVTPSVSLSDVSGTSDLQAIEALTGTSGFLKKTAADTWQLNETMMVILSYGTSTWNDFITAYKENAIVYCRASSNSNPATGSQNRMAFMAYINNADPNAITEVEFQYYRSVATHSDSQQGDQVFVYKLNKTSGWSVTTRETMSKIAVGSSGGLSKSYSSGTITLSMDSTLKSKLDGIASGAEVNQNAFSNVKVDSTTIAASSATDTVEFAAGTNVTLTPNSSDKKVTIAATDTTYTFTDGTNGFTVTPSGGTAQTVTVTPSITNNITGSGTSGYLAKFNGANTITSGPRLGTSTTTFLNNKGEWTTPAGTYSHPTGDGNLHVPATSTINNGKFLKAGATAGSISWESITATDAGITITSTSVSDGTNTFNKYTHPTTAGNKHIPSGGSSNQYLKYSSSGTATWATISTSDISGYSSGVTSITPGNGLINGTSGSSQTAITSTGTISIKEGGVTNAMLAGSIANEKLSNSKVTIAGNDVSLGGSLAADTLRTSLGLSNALHFIGISTSAMADNTTTVPTISGKTYSSPEAGDVVIEQGNNYEFVWDGSKWERLGGDLSYKTVQTAVTDPTASSTTSTTFIDSITQDANGVISATKKTLPSCVTNLTWNSANTKITKSVDSGTAANFLTFSAGDGIQLTGASTSLTIAAKTIIKEPYTGGGGVLTETFPILLSDTTNNSGKLYKATGAKISLTGSTSGTYALELGDSDSGSNIKLYHYSDYYAQIASPINRTTSTTFYLPLSSSSSRYLTHVASTSAVGSSGLPVYVDTNGAITSCTKADLQANIFVVSDTAPSDTSVLWLKPIS